MLVHAEWDVDLPSYMLYEYYTKLVNTPYKTMLQISEGTHSVMMEKNRMLMFRGVQEFLDNSFQPEK
jgi:hypothetical protein